LPPLDHVDDRIATSIAWWREWIARSTYRGPYRDSVERSLLVLELLDFAPSGAIVIRSVHRACP
jgi:GH15 family glucan-1,4-alpha-glucosidase